jgi:hypothetical protein
VTLIATQRLILPGRSLPLGAYSFAVRLGNAIGYSGGSD